ncbi:zinc transporter-like protein [Actinidia rufa]|uniref:Zinc transporter-like protein n=1 Tax=Actinidia rufa TaxID=165716 RepID=A0A7J0EKV5_9ERIC|nr:zinc transporter-like protein [Actinidia rufa]
MTLIMKPIRHILRERKSRKIALFLLINMGYMVVEFVAGFMSNSLGLISDACHMLFDCSALAIGLYASYISRLPANSQFNYGRGRILDPLEISTNSLLTVSIGGLVVNVVGLIFFHEEHHHAHGGTGSYPVYSIFISVLIVSSVISLLRNSAEVLLQRVPRANEQDLKEALTDVMKIKGVRGIQNLHVWSFTITDIVGTLHLHVLTQTDQTTAKAQVSHILRDAGIKDLTVQLESVKST